MPNLWILAPHSFYSGSPCARDVQYFDIFYVEFSWKRFQITTTCRSPQTHIAELSIV